MQIIILIVIVIFLFIFLCTKIESFKNKTRWGIFLQTKNPVDIETWIDHHMKLEPDIICITIENDPDLKISDNPKIYKEYKETPPNHTWGSDLDHRLASNFNHMIDIAKKKGTEWMIKIDDDELLLNEDNTPVSETLSKVKTNSIQILNQEALYPYVNKDSKTCFIKGTSFINCKENPGRCNSYGNGKAFGKISVPGVTQSGSHYMRGPNTSRNFLPKEKLTILHFESCSYDRWKEKFKNINKEKDKKIRYVEFDGTLQDFFKRKNFKYYYDSMNIFNKKNSEDDLIKLYSKNKIINENINKPATKIDFKK